LELKLNKKPKSRLIQAAELNTGADAAMDVQTGFGLMPCPVIGCSESKTEMRANGRNRKSAILNVGVKNLMYTAKI
jgi:hypothetical protein